MIKTLEWRNKMIKSESDCLDCGLPCKYELCPHYRIKRLYCDKCKDEVDKLYKYGEEELCEDCLVKEFEVVELEEN
jgi:hypothetical protein